MNRTERFRLLNRFIGFGNPNARIWFIGLEEAGCWDRDPQKDEEKYRKYAAGHFWFEPGDIERDRRGREMLGKGYTKIYDIMSKLVVQLEEGESFVRERWELVRDEELLVRNGRAFQANLYPLGKPHRTDWPDHYNALFGFGKQDKDRYRTAVEEERIPCFREAWRGAQPRVTVCFGRESWGLFKVLLELGDENRREGAWCEIYDAHGVALVPFFSYRSMFHSRISMLASHLRHRLRE